MTKYRGNVQDLRARLGKDAVAIPGSDAAEKASKMIITNQVVRFIASAVMNWGPITATQLKQRTGLKNGPIYSSLNTLDNLGVLSIGMAMGKGTPKVYSFLDNDIEGLRRDELTDLESLRPQTAAGIPEGDSASDNPLTKALSLVDHHIPLTSIDGYRKVIDDIKGLNDGGRYGIDEIDRILDCIIELSKKRIDEADYKCPVCRKGRLEKDITAAYCTNSKCKAFANGGSFELSVKMLEFRAEMEKGGDH